MEQEIDLRPFLAALVRRWRIIVLITVGAAAIGLAIAMLSPAPHTASASVLIIPRRSQINYDPRFVTNDIGPGADVAARRQALLALARSLTVETEARNALAPDLASRYLQPGKLHDQIKISSTGDLIQITASAADDQQAQAIADAWARAYVRLVRQLYGSDSAFIKDLQGQLDEARKRYDAAQAELETFIGASDRVQIEQRVTGLQGLLDSSTAWSRLLYSQYLSRTHELDLVLRDAAALSQQLAANQAGSFGDSLAALVLRVRLASDGQAPVDLRVDGSGAAPEDRQAILTTLEALMQAVQQQRRALLEEAQELAREIAEGKAGGSALPPAQRASYETELAGLRQRFEQQLARQRLLEQRRDLALDSLNILQRKLDEQQVAQMTAAEEVRFVSTVVDPPRSPLMRVLPTLALGVAAGLLLGVAAALVLHFRRAPVAAAPSQRPDERPLDSPATR